MRSSTKPPESLDSLLQKIPELERERQIAEFEFRAEVRRKEYFLSISNFTQNLFTTHYSATVSERFWKMLTGDFEDRSEIWVPRFQRHAPKAMDALKLALLSISYELHPEYKAFKSRLDELARIGLPDVFHLGLKQYLASRIVFFDLCVKRAEDDAAGGATPPAATATATGAQPVAVAPGESKPKSALEEPGLPDPLKQLGLFLRKSEQGASVEQILNEFDEYPSNIAKIGRYLNYDTWIKRHLKRKGKVWKFVE